MCACASPDAHAHAVIKKAEVELTFACDQELGVFV